METNVYKLLELKGKKNIFQKFICSALFFKLLSEEAAWIRKRNIQKEDLVLDVGCGYFSNIRANVSCEKYIFDFTERPSKACMKIDRPLLVADAVHLPLEDKSFDYVLCKHLLEHMDEPESLLKELSRVARKGYIETPSLVSEKIYGHPFHKWVVSVSGNKLIIRAKQSKILDEVLHQWFADVKILLPQLEGMMIENEELIGLITKYEWQDNIEYELIRDGAFTDFSGTDWAQLRQPQLDNDELLKPFFRLSKLERMQSLFGRKIRGNSDKKLNLLSLLHCPMCKGGLEKALKDKADLSCLACKVGFPVRRGIYFMLPEYSYKL